MEESEGVPGEMDCVDWRGCCCAEVVELRVYIVRNGISYVPG